MLDVLRTILVPIGAAAVLLLMRTVMVRRGHVGQHVAFLLAAACCAAIGLVNLYLTLVRTA